MSVKNLVLEFCENESAAELQTRLDKAAEDGYFLVNVVGRFAFLRTSAAQQQKVLPVVTDADLPVNEDALAMIRKALKNCRTDITLEALRRAAKFHSYPDKEWYRALERLEQLGEIALKKHISHGGRMRTIVVKAEHGA